MWSYSRGRGWRCPGEDTLAAYIEQKVFGGERARIERHLAACGACRDQVGFLLRAQAEPAPESVPAGWLVRARALGPASTRARVPAWHWGTAAAATACLLLAVMLGVKPRPATRPPGATLSPPSSAQLRVQPEVQPLRPQVSTPAVRSQRYALRAPEVIFPKPHSTVAQKTVELRWKEMLGAMGYEVRLANAEGDVLWEQRTQGHSATIPSNLVLEPGQTYFLWVRAYLPEGRAAQSKAIPFTVAGER